LITNTKYDIQHYSLYIDEYKSEILPRNKNVVHKRKVVLFSASWCYILVQMAIK